jgi:hypothetical protein
MRKVTTIVAAKQPWEFHVLPPSCVELPHIRCCWFFQGYNLVLEKLPDSAICTEPKCFKARADQNIDPCEEDFKYQTRAIYPSERGCRTLDSFRAAAPMSVDTAHV